MSPAAWRQVTGLFLLLVFAAIALIIKCPTNSQKLAIYALMGVSTACFFYHSVTKASFVIKFRNWSYTVGGPITIIIFLIFFDPIRLKGDSCDKPVSVTVFVHGTKGVQDKVLRQQAHVIMDVGGERKKELITDKGTAQFQNLHIGDKVRVDVEFSEPYISICPDSQYVISDNGNIDLSVTLRNNDKIQGKVLYNEEPLPGVIVQFNDLTDTTDEIGRYKLSIPESLRDHGYKVSFIKKGFKNSSVMAYPQTGQALDIIMEKNY